MCSSDLNYLPKEMVKLLDLDSIQLQKDSYIDEKLKKSFSDLVFQIQTKESVGYISILFEHKSYPTEEISLQLLRYICNIWEEKYKKENFLAKKTFRILFDTKCLFYFYLFRFQTLTWFTTNKL